MYIYLETLIHLPEHLFCPFFNPPVLRKGVCSLRHGCQPLGSVGSRLPDDLPGPLLDGGHHCCPTQPGHWTEHWVPGAAEEAGTESSSAAGTGSRGGPHSHFVTINSKMQTFSLYSESSLAEVSSTSHLFCFSSHKNVIVSLPAVIKMC